MGGIQPSRLIKALALIGGRITAGWPKRNVAWKVFEQREIVGAIKRFLTVDADVTSKRRKEPSDRKRRVSSLFEEIDRRLTLAEKASERKESQV